MVLDAVTRLKSMAQDGEGWGLEEGAFFLGKSHGPETGEWQALQRRRGPGCPNW